MPKKFLLVGAMVTIVTGAVAFGGYSQHASAAVTETVSEVTAIDPGCDTFSAIDDFPGYAEPTLTSLGNTLDGFDEDALISFHEVQGCWIATCSSYEWVYMGPDRGWVKVKRVYSCEICAPVDHDH